MNGMLRSFIHQLVSLRADTDYDGTAVQVRAGAELSASNVWSLAFAIFIASVGLNVNSTAVIIGAMLISPLMGPIVGTGLALGTDDIQLLRLSLRNLALSTTVALIVSTVYFFISPLADAQSELLARTRPTLYDVLIALFGGAAGIVAASRRTGGGNVVPGVAIATALMPPLCTAGFGLAHGDLSFFLGAMHLFLINALFICLSTLVFVRAMKFARIAETPGASNRRVHSVIVLLTVSLVLPSVYTGLVIVRETRFQRAARRFITERIRSPDRTLLNVDLHFDKDGSVITAAVLGPVITDAGIDSLRRQLPMYGLAATKLLVRQPLQQTGTLDALRDQLRQSIQEDKSGRADASIAAASQQTQLLTTQLAAARAAQLPTAQIFQELSALEPSLDALELGRQVSRADSLNGAEGTATAIATWTRLPSVEVKARVWSFLRTRLQVDSVAVTNVRSARPR